MLAAVYFVRADPPYIIYLSFETAAGTAESDFGSAGLPAVGGVLLVSAGDTFVTVAAVSGGLASALPGGAEAAGATGALGVGGGVGAVGAGVTVVAVTGTTGATSATGLATDGSDGFSGDADAGKFGGGTGFCTVSGWSGPVPCARTLGIPAAGLTGGGGSGSGACGS